MSGPRARALLGPIMHAYEQLFAPAAFPLNNTGAICHFNALLQALASCTAFTTAILRSEGRTRTGTALKTFVSAYAASGGARMQPDPKIQELSAPLMSALVGELRANRPDFTFGASQEASTEGLVLLLDMLTPPGAPEDQTARLFTHRYLCIQYCPACKRRIGEERIDTGIHVFTTHFARLRHQPATPKEFSEALRLYIMDNDIPCPQCGARFLQRICQLVRAPEIFVCLFNIYDHPRRQHYVPPTLEFPALGGGTMFYRLVALVDHSGSLDGGHYTARALRQGGPYELNSSAPPVPAQLAATPNTYMAFYHYAKSEPAAV